MSNGNTTEDRMRAESLHTASFQGYNERIDRLEVRSFGAAGSRLIGVMHITWNGLDLVSMKLEEVSVK